ncbi:uncharacterized protein BDZ83DRAFT_377937 [Colletotrichum acutatum]|uniref:Uncharacterized protein n=1 Tax=Glomerella acutata TaxID=27357 RepID=A0AAD8XNP9_GLOAC|nr:uncharacterized protein BDZ83DRAFT_377937 [Colletotrichum acutatum]KAK1730634.1 hypothetical protein BDZ83DRAFT_377937 [Colletotrichum acutatum]
MANLRRTSPLHQAINAVHSYRITPKHQTTSVLFSAFPQAAAVVSVSFLPAYNFTSTKMPPAHPLSAASCLQSPPFPVPVSSLPALLPPSPPPAS